MPFSKSPSQRSPLSHMKMPLPCCRPSTNSPSYLFPFGQKYVPLPHLFPACKSPSYLPLSVYSSSPLPDMWSPSNGPVYLVPWLSPSSTHTNEPTPLATVPDRITPSYFRPASSIMIVWSSQLALIFSHSFAISSSLGKSPSLRSK
eukprot:c21451_g1_i1.p3 GENE.c21451_g1_i1~~c21451_g1_i1.p3  ORF type:complete len:146 (+),score=15.53 c21451_g1_i1:494-931(+)